MENDSGKVNLNSTRKNLIHSGIKLFSQFGYEATSTRMIAEDAKVNLSAISFHFSGKENLYIECIKYVSQISEEYYVETFNKVNESIQNKTINSELAYNFICELIDLQLEVAFKFKYRKTVRLIYWEQINPVDNFHPLTNTIYKEIENVCAKLLMIATNNKMSQEQAIIASRFMHGGIISFAEHDLLVRYSLNITDNSRELPEWIQNEIRKYCQLMVKNVIYHFTYGEMPESETIDFIK